MTDREKEIIEELIIRLELGSCARSMERHRADRKMPESDHAKGRRIGMLEEAEERKEALLKTIETLGELIHCKHPMAFGQ